MEKVEREKKKKDEGGETEMSLIFHQSISFKFEIDYARVEQNSSKKSMVQDWEKTKRTTCLSG